MMINKLKIGFIMSKKLLILLLGLAVSACGGSSKESVDDMPDAPIPPPEVIEPPTINTTSIFGLSEINGGDLGIFITKDKSYLFSSAWHTGTENASELMCESDDLFSEFDDNNLSQSINFNCEGTNDGVTTSLITVVVTLDGDTLAFEVHDDSYQTYNVKLNDVFSLSDPETGVINTTSPVRNDLHVSRYMLASRSSLTLSSRSWTLPTLAEKCNKFYRYAIDGELVLSEGESYAEGAYKYSSGTGNYYSDVCQNHTLPMPRPGDSVNAKIYTLEKEAYFVVVKTAGFITVSKMIKSG
jgi:hypothetical protein